MEMILIIVSVCCTKRSNLRKKKKEKEKGFITGFTYCEKVKLQRSLSNGWTLDDSCFSEGLKGTIPSVQTGKEGYEMTQLCIC